MKLFVTLTFSCMDEKLPQFLQKVIASGCSLQSLQYVSSSGDVTTYRADIVYSDRKIFKEKVLQWVNRECTVLECSDILSKGIEGGLLKITSKLPFDSAGEFESKILGYIEILKDNDITAEMSRYTGISQNCGMLLLSQEHAELLPKEVYEYILIERDSLVVSHCTSLHPQPLLIRYKTKEDIHKIINSVANNFALMRIAHLDSYHDIMGLNLDNENRTPVILREFDEIPLYCLVKVTNVLRKHHTSLEDSVIGIIGIRASSLRFTRLLYSMGCSKVLGYDANEHNLYHFEKERGIATTIDNVLENADVVIFLLDSCSNEDFYKLEKGQIVIVNPNIHIDNLIFQERGVKEYQLLNIENSYLLLPGLAERMLKEGLNSLSDELILTISKKISNANVDTDNSENMYRLKELITD